MKGEITDVILNPRFDIHKPQRPEPQKNFVDECPSIYGCRSAAASTGLEKYVIRLSSTHNYYGTNDGVQ